MNPIIAGKVVLSALGRFAGSPGGKLALKVLGGLLALFLAYRWHESKVHRLHDTAFHEGATAESMRLSARSIVIRDQAEALRRRAEATAVQITGEIDRDHIQGVDRVRARGAGLLMRGPAKAYTCPRVDGGPVPGLPGTAGIADAAPGEQYARVGWQSLVAGATACAIDAKTLTDLQAWVSREKAAADAHAKAALAIGE